MKRYSEAKRIRLVREFETGRMRNAAEFCRCRHISTGSLARWRRCYGAEASAEAVPPAGDRRWLPVVLTGDAAAAASAANDALAGYVVHAGAARLEVPRGFDVREVRLLCAVLGLGNQEASA